MFNFIKLFVVLGAIVLIIYFVFIRQSDEDIPTALKVDKRPVVEMSNLNVSEPFKEMLNLVFNDFGLLPEWVRKSGNSINVRLPAEVITEVMVHRLISDSRRIGWDVNASFEDISKNRTVLELKDGDNRVQKIVMIQETDLHINQGKIAIIIDDFGYDNAEMTERMITTPERVTLSIIPGAPHSRAIYERALNNQKETLIHLPMEADDQKVDYTDYTLYSQMTDEQIRARVQKAITDYPSSSGMNNHMGSKITSDERIMSIVVDELKKSGKFFIDSRTTDRSVAYKVARSVNLPSAENSLFLEQSDSDSEDYLIKKLEALAKIANARGSAIGIGHDYATTIKVLLEQIPKFKEKGYEFVYVSELLRSN